jgi:hypothetical protein
MLNKILILIISLLIVLIPSLKYIFSFYYTFGLFAISLLLFLLFIILKIKLELKLIILTFLFIIFQNTYRTVGKMLFEMYKLIHLNIVDKRKDDSTLRDIVKNIYSPILVLKTNFKKLPNKPTIFVSNYCNDIFENLSCILIPKDIAILMRDGLKKTTKLHKLVKWPIFTSEKNNYENIKNEILNHIKEGRSIFAYITKYPHDIPNMIHNVRSGMFSLAKELNIPINLVAIDYIDREFYNIQKQNFHIEIGETFNVDNVQDAIYKTRKYYRKTLTKFIKKKYIT